MSNEILRLAYSFLKSVEVIEKTAATKLDLAFQEDTGMSIVEYARKLRNASYNEWEKKQRLPSGMDRVDIDTRPMGRLGAIFKNYDYSQDYDKKTQSPGLGLHSYQAEYSSTKDFIDEKRSRTEKLYSIIKNNGLS